MTIVGFVILVLLVLLIIWVYAKLAALPSIRVLWAPMVKGGPGFCTGAGRTYAPSS